MLIPRPPKLDAPGTLHYVMGHGIDRTNIFRKQEEEDLQGTEIVLPAGGEEDGLSGDGDGLFPWRDYFGRRSRCRFRGSA